MVKVYTVLNCKGALNVCQTGLHHGLCNMYMLCTTLHLPYNVLCMFNSD